MRTDPEVKAKQAKGAKNPLEPRGPMFFQGGFRSFSGHERNKLFVGRRGTEFIDVSNLSGLDSPGDGRGFAYWDYDRDGRQDIALVNNNAPTVNLFRNRIGEIDGGPVGRMVAVRFVGSNWQATPARGRSTRDGVGAQVRAELGDLTLVREYRCGEGLAAQNSATLNLGIGDHPKVQRLSVRWPSGRAHRIDEVAAGSLVTAYEDPSQSPNGQAFVIGRYGPVAASARRPPSDNGDARLQLAGATGKGPRPSLCVYTTMATWCEACKNELPEVRRLRTTFSASEVGLYGVPIDENDDPPKLASYVEKMQPAYVLLGDLSKRDVGRVKKVVDDEMRQDVLPTSVVTDSDGRVLLVTGGVPAVSNLRRLLDHSATPARP